MLLRSITAATVLAAAMAAPAKAATPTLDPLKPCYVAAREDQREYVVVSAHYFTPFAKVGVYVDDILQSEPIADVDGDLSGMVNAPFPEVPQRAFVLRVTEEGKLIDNTAETSALVTKLTVSQSPKQASTSRRVRFRGRGFTEPGPVYAHYVFAGKSRKTVRLRVPRAPCGVFSVKRKQFPFKKRPQVGVWTIQFDQQPRYDPQAAVRFPLTVKVRKRIKPRRAHRSAS
jgi:hypothetical protein